MQTLCNKAEEASELRGFKRTELEMSVLPDMPSFTLRMIPSTTGLKNGRFVCLRRELGGCVLSHTKLTALASCHRDGQHAQNIGDQVLISRYFGGRSIGYRNDSAIDRKLGAIYFLDGALTWQGVRNAGTLQTAYLPKSLIGFSTDTHPGFCAIAPDTPIGRSLNSIIDALFQPEKPRPNHSLECELERLVAGVKIALGTNPKRGDVRAYARETMYRTICDHIERHLDSAALSSTYILQNFGVSRSALYRMFEPHGGVRNYITERRTLRAICELANTSGQRGQVRSIGERWGFTSPGEFNRTVRRLYEDSPGALFRSTKSNAMRAAA